MFNEFLNKRLFRDCFFSENSNSTTKNENGHVNLENDSEARYH